MGQLVNQLIYRSALYTMLEKKQRAGQRPPLFYFSLLTFALLLHFQRSPLAHQLIERPLHLAVTRRVIRKVQLDDALRVRHVECKVVMPIGARKQGEQFAHAVDILVVVVRARQENSQVARRLVPRGWFCRACRFDDRGVHSTVAAIRFYCRRAAVSTIRLLITDY
jgi:hypothetical protein